MARTVAADAGGATWLPVVAEQFARADHEGMVLNLVVLLTPFALAFFSRWG